MEAAEHLNPVLQTEQADALCVEGVGDDQRSGKAPTDYPVSQPRRYTEAESHLAWASQVMMRSKSDGIVGPSSQVAERLDDSFTAYSIASVRLSSLAMPLPAMSKAVP